MHQGVTSLKRAIIRFCGIVQGVGMRYFIAREARRLGLTGYVRNLDDGSVEVVAEGSEELIEELIRTTKNEGPGFVSQIKVAYGEFKGEFKDFKIMH
mgnify:CR=1 FL=1